jgi:alpha-methylacyl-CoA racemase
MASGPLAGIRLIEMDAIGPVPLCGMILSGLGAEIVRLTRPGGQGAWGDVGDAVLLRGRTSVAVDLKSASGKATVLELVARADGLIEGARPGVMERLGLGPDECLARNPRLVYGRMTGWGQNGPLSQSAGHDINYIAMTGALHAISEEGRPPTVPLNLIGDYAGGTMFLALGMVSAILSGRQTGVGQVVDAAMVDGVANLLSLYHAWLSTEVWDDRPFSNLFDGAAPFYRCYTCKDGRYIAVGALEPQFFAQLLSGLEMPADRYDQNDRSCWPAMAAEFSRTFVMKTREEWEVRFREFDACVSPVLSMREAMVHPANEARKVFTVHNGVTQSNPAPRFSSTPGGIAPGQVLSAQEVIAAWAPPDRAIAE